jgi:hypothetical protein
MQTVLRLKDFSPIFTAATSSADSSGIVTVSHGVSHAVLWYHTQHNESTNPAPRAQLKKHKTEKSLFRRAPSARGGPGWPVAARARLVGMLLAKVGQATRDLMAPV